METNPTKTKYGTLIAKAFACALPLLGLPSQSWAALVGHWTFETGEELIDRTGNFPSLLLKGDAQVLDGQLDLNGSGTSATGWAVTDSDSGSYTGPVITNKTLISWITLQGLGDIANAGSALTLDRVGGDQFDGIILGERENNRWMNGSSFWSRTQDLVPGFEETEIGTLIQLAFTYEHLPAGGLRVTGYRNGVSIGEYEAAAGSQWNPSDAEALFGVRHGSTASGPGALDGLIAEARIYNAALSASEIASIYAAGLTVLVDSDGDGLRDDWETENFGNLAQNASGDPDADGVSNADELRRGTNPNESDSDDDGLRDQVETGTGTFVDANDTGTNPNRADTDGDGLNDVVETNTGIFLSATNTGTDPNNSNTDGDRLNDGAEVTGGTSPVNPRDPAKTLSDFLVGHWKFQAGGELVDSAGNFPNLLLKGDASVTNGQLNVNGAGTTAAGWAVTDSATGSYRGPAITNKTLVAWVVLEGLEAVAKSASAITLDRVNSDQFDGIIFAERQRNRWVSGSSGWQRTQDFNPGFEETETGKLTQLAISYEHLAGGRLRVTGYRNGVQTGQYETGNASRWEPGDAEVFFGVRHGSLESGPGGLDALIEEAAIYRVALNPAQVNLLYNVGPDTGAPLLGHWTFEPGDELTDLSGHFPSLLLKGNASVANGQLDVNGAGTTASGWAVTDSGSDQYGGPLIESKTLVAWLRLEGLSDAARAGSALTLDRVTGDQFDGIIFAEREDNRWMNGSSGWQRTLNFDPGFEESAIGTLLNVAITYEMVDGSLRVTGYRNGEFIGQNEGFPPSSWSSDDAEVFFGARHGSTAGGPGALDARIEEARIYGGALSSDQIWELSGKGPILSEDRDADGMADSWEIANFGNVEQGATGDPDSDNSSNIHEFTRGTNPANPDSDNDGYKDGSETKTGQFASATDTGTDPLKEDSDGDGLKDGVETSTGIFLSATNTGTDPNKVDSDEDGIGDGAEVQAGTNPTNSLDPARPPISNYLIGHWTFNTGQELVDLAGNFPPLLLMGDAQIVDGKLDLNGSATSASGWAVTDSDNGAYDGPEITNKTLVVWATMQGLADVAVGGSLMTIDRVNSDQFDGIIFAERQNNRWMNGSSFWNRTIDFNPGFEETALDIPIHLAITYETIGGSLRVTAYRNGARIGQYDSGTPSSWTASDAEVFFGIRHGTTAGGGGAVDALIDEARLYNHALNAFEIRQLYAPPVGGPTLSVSRVGTKVRIVWADGAARLEAANAVSGGWAPVPNAQSPFEEEFSLAARRYFRLVK